MERPVGVSPTEGCDRRAHGTARRHDVPNHKHLADHDEGMLVYKLVVERISHRFGVVGQMKLL
jgi:hypothetical protein